MRQTMTVPDKTIRKGRVWSGGSKGKAWFALAIGPGNRIIFHFSNWRAALKHALTVTPRAW